jgi:hypothetical protein
LYEAALNQWAVGLPKAQPTQMAIPLQMDEFLNSWSLQCSVFEGKRRENRADKHILKE